MARLPRICAPGHVHLLVQRGNNGQPVFLDDRDRARFVHLLGDAARAAKVAIHAYALADNQVFVLATPEQANSLSNMMQSLGRRYVGEFNRRHGRSGTLWDGRFRATAIEAELHLQACISFVELAPLSAANAADAQAHRWSSARHHLGLVVDPLVTEHPLYWASGNTPFEREAAHRRRLELGLEQELQRRIASAAAKGWALGSARFAERLSEASGRRVTPGRRGRPRRPAPETVPGYDVSPINTMSAPSDV